MVNSSVSLEIRSLEETCTYSDKRCGSTSQNNTVLPLYIRNTLDKKMVVERFTAFRGHFLA